MEVTKILADLRREREQIEETILSLERLPKKRRRRRRGRMSAWMTKKRDDDSVAGISSEELGDVLVPRVQRSPRRPPRISRAGAALQINWPLADAIGRLK
jgi:hypothetical protein